MNNRSRKLWSAKVLIPLGSIILISILGWMVVSPRLNAATAAGLEPYVRSQGYIPLIPIQDELSPGCVLRLEERGQSLAIPASAFQFPNPVIDHKSANEVTVDVDVSSQADASAILPGIDQMKLRASGVEKIELRLKDVIIRELPLQGVGDVIRADKKLMAVVAKGGNVILVNKTMVAASAECRFVGSRRTGEDLKVTGTAGTKGSLSLDFQQADKSSIIATGPMVLGFTGYEPKSVALDFGSEKTQLLIDLKAGPLGPPNADKAREQMRTGPKTEFDVFGLCIGLGNHRAQLPGARASAQRMAELLNLLAPDGCGDRIHLHVSGTEPQVMDSSGRATAKTIRIWLKDFGKHSEKAIHAAARPLVIFYYCGHGVAEGLGQGAFIVPEDFALAGKPIREFKPDEVVSVFEVAESIRNLSANCVLLFDMCRTHDNDEDMFYSGLHALGQSKDTWSPIIDVLKFTSGNEGPAPVLFPVESGVAALPVSDYWASQEVGPLAAKLNALFDAQRVSRKRLTLRDFLAEMEAPTTLFSGATVRAHTKLRRDFRSSLAESAIFTGRVSLTANDATISPHSTQTNQQPPQAITTTKGTLRHFNGVIASTILSPGIQKVSDFAVTDNQNECLVLEFTGRLWRCLANRERPELLNTFDGSVNLAADRVGNIYLYRNDTFTIERSRDGVSFEAIAKRIEPGVWANSVDDRSVIYVQQGAISGESYTVLRVTDKGATAIDKFPTGGIDAAVEWSAGELAFVLTDGLLCVRKDGKTRHVGNGPPKPGRLCADANWLYCIDDDRRQLYRVNHEGLVHIVDLSGLSLDADLTTERFCRLAMMSQNRILVWTAGGLVQLDINEAAWRVPSRNP